MSYGKAYADRARSKTWTGPSARSCAGKAGNTGRSVGDGESWTQQSGMHATPAAS